jgi:hypothetical protein
MSVRSDIYDGISIPELGDNARVTAQYKPTKYMYSSAAFNDYQGTQVAKGLMPYNAKDKRRSVYDATKVGTEDVAEIEDGGGWLAWCYKGRPLDTYGKVDMSQEPKLHFFGKLKNVATGEPHLGDKFWCPGMVYTQDSNNLKIFRFAHIVLDLAEAHMRCGNWDLAFKYQNATKNRAGRLDESDGGHANEELFMENLQKESARELFGEFTRRHNLVRWGKWHDHIARYAEYDVFRENVKEGPCREYYPIPDQQIILSNYNLSNPEYDKYGL